MLLFVWIALHQLMAECAATDLCMGYSPGSLLEMVMVDVSEIESLRSKLPEGLKKELEDETLARFIRATGGDLENVRICFAGLHVNVFVDL